MKVYLPFIIAPAAAVALFYVVGLFNHIQQRRYWRNAAQRLKEQHQQNELNKHDLWR